MVRRILAVLGVTAVLAGGGVAAAAWLRADDETADARHLPRLASTTTTTTVAPTSTTAAPPLTAPPTSKSGIVQPVEARLPAPPPDGLAPGADGPIVTAYQQRFVDLRFDPGPVDGAYGPALTYAVQALQKFKGLEVTGVIGVPEMQALNQFTYPEPLQANGEANRTEVDVAKQVMVLYERGQPRLLTTVSTGSGEEYCYDTPLVNPTRHICELATTPSGRFTYYLHRPGWDIGVNGGMYNPFYFNAGVAVHGLQSVPTHPASHGCVRIPMHIAEYWPTLVKRGDPVYVFGGAPFKVLSSESLVPEEPEPTAPPVTAPPATTPATTTTTTTTTSPPSTTLPL